MKNRNIVYMHSHDTGRYISPYGYAMPTPNLMALAEESSLFRQMYCAGPTCSPSRTAQLSGMYPHAAGMIGLAHRGFAMDDYDRHIVSYLQKQGYDTALSGVQHEAVSPGVIGYDNVLTSPDTDSDKEWDMNNAMNAAAFIRNKRPGEPFFLSYGMFNTHRPFPEIDADINPDYVVPPFPLYDSPANRLDMAGYMSSVRITDTCVGIVLQALREAGLEEDTIVIYTTDHGIAFPGMKCNLYDTGIGVSFMIKYPGNASRGQALDALASQVDIFPTLCELSGLEKPSWLQGHSLVPLLEGKLDRVRDEIFAEVTYHAAYEPMRCVRTDRYKLIRHYDEHDGIVPANIDDGYSKSYLLEHGLLETIRAKEQLFDLALDPVERVNLIADSRYQAVRTDLAGRLDRWMRETGDPLLQGGRVPKPAGAIANKLTCVSPETDDFE